MTPAALQLKTPAMTIPSPKTAANVTGSAPPRLALRSEVIILCAVGLLAAVALILWPRELESRGTILVSQIVQLSPEVEKATAGLVKVRKVRRRYEEQLDLAAAVAADEALTGCAPALRVLAIDGGAAISLQRAALAPAESLQTWNLQLQGAATGMAPRSVADGYLQSLQRDLSRSYSIVEPCRFLRLDEESPASGSPHRAPFTITARLMVQSSGGTVDHP